MAKRLLLFFSLVFLTVLFVQADVSAGGSMRTLQPGRTYEFVGVNPGLISHVNVSGGKYEFVEKNADGQIVRFGFSDRRITISGTSRMAITPVSPLRVSFDSGRLRLYVSEGSVLEQSDVQPGQTISINNQGNKDAHVRVSLIRGYYYDFVILDGFGEVTGFDFESRFPQISLPAGGSVVITAGHRAITVYYPSSLGIWVSWPLEPIMTVQPLLVGFQTSISNESRAAREFVVRTPGGVNFRYTFVLRGSDGHTVDYGSSTGNNLSVPPRSTLYITPLISAELAFPSKFGTIALASGNISAYQSLQPGETIVVANTNNTLAHRIFAASSTAFGYFSLDYVLYQNGSFSWGIAENITTEWAINLEAGAVIIITVTDAIGHAAINIPSVEGISFSSRYETAKIRYFLTPGESAYVINNSSYLVDVLFSADNLRFGPDYVRYDLRSGDVESFGRAGVLGNIELGREESVLITSTEYPVAVAIPRALTDYGLTIETSERTALVRIPLRHNETLQVDNSDRRFNRFVVVEDDTWRSTRGFTYDFSLTQLPGATRYTVLDFGINEPGLHIMPPNSRLSILPEYRSEASVAFPSEWYNRVLRTRFVYTAPLHRFTLAPGRHITLSNTTNDDFVIANNSSPSGAGFHLRQPGESTRIPVGEVAKTGDITLAARERIVVIAARGANLEMWLPRSIARQLGLLR